MASDTLNVSAIALNNIDPEMLFDYQWALVEKADQARRQELAQLKTVKQWEARKRYVREKVMEMIGDFPSRTPLNARVTSVVDHKDYKVLMVIYESRPQFYVTANLYIPKNCSFPAPGVLFACGHWPEAKAADTYQACCIGLAKKGYVALSFDPLGQGERLQHWEIDLQQSPTGATIYEHAQLGNVCALLGYNLANFFIWDGVRSLDYLISRPEVDPKRIACIGNSGGGTQTTYISALDDRVKVAVPDCYITTLYDRTRVRCTADDEQNFNPCFVYGIDHFDLLSLRAPKPIQINAAKEDFFPIVGARHTFKDLQNLYRIYDAVDRVNLLELGGPHGYTEPHREGTYAWLNRWLGKESEGATEPEITLEPEDALQCTTSGQVVESLGGETVYTLNKAFYKKIKYKRSVPTDSSGLKAWRADLRADIRRLLALPSVSGPPEIVRGKPEKCEEGTKTRVEFESEPGIVVPGMLLLPKKSPSGVTIMVFEDGKDAHLRDDRVLEIVKSGRAVYLIDPRGVGETMSHHGDRKRYYDYFREETDLTYTSFMLGKPLLGQRVFDVMRAVGAVTAMTEVGCDDVALEGQGRGALMVFFAGALDERVSKVTCRNMLVSYESLVMNKYFRHHPASIIPGALRSFDLPLVAALVAPRALVLEDTVDEMKEIMPPYRVREIYKPAESVYRMRGNVRGFAVR